MPLTRKFVETVQARASYDPAFKAALFEEAIQALFEGDLDGAKELLRDCINATVGFQVVSERAGLPVKSVMRMVGPGGNPRLENFVTIVQVLQAETCMKATVCVINQDNVDLRSVLSSRSSDLVAIDDLQMMEV